MAVLKNLFQGGSQFNQILVRSLNNAKPLHSCVRWDLSGVGQAPCSSYITEDMSTEFQKIDSRKRTKGQTRGTRRGVKRDDGEVVSAGTILVRQLGLLYFPGLNVGLGRNRDLFAMEHGRVVITTERVRPDWDQAVMRAFLGQYEGEDHVPIYKTYFHVLSFPMPRNFKLVDRV